MYNQGLIDSFGEEGMQLPKRIMQMRPHSSKNSNSILYSPGNQQLRLRLDLNGWGFTVVKQSNCNQGLGGLLVLKRFIFSNMRLRICIMLH